MDDHRLIFRVHAVQRMFERGITEIEIRAILTDPTVVEAYPLEVPYPTRLLLGWADTRPLHIVVAEPDPTTTIILTVYEPDPRRWDAALRHRLP
ncbi:MAG: DUF4258 domain-containing protein [Phycisphaerales bacterium]